MKEEEKKTGEEETPEEYRARCRETAIIRLIATAIDLMMEAEDLNDLTQSTRELAKANKEIWARIKPNKVSELVDADQSATTISAAAPPEMKFYRYGYFSVQASTCRSNWFSPSQVHFGFQTSTELMTETFGDMPIIPSALVKILSKPSYSGSDSVLPLYEEYIDKAMLLDDTILKLFLTVLKEHLKWVLVLLKEIEAWVLEPINNLNYINEQFDTKLESPKPKGCNGTCGSHHDDNAMCIRCFHPLHSHGLLGSLRRRDNHPHCSTEAYLAQRRALSEPGQMRVVSVPALFWLGPETHDIRSFDIQGGDASFCLPFATTTMSFPVGTMADKTKLEKFLEEIIDNAVVEDWKG